MRFSLSFITRETGFGQSRQLMCSEVLEDPVLPQKEFFITLQVRGSCKFKHRGFLLQGWDFFSVRFSLSFITRETGFGWSRQLMCSEVLEDPVLPLKEFL